MIECPSCGGSGIWNIGTDDEGNEHAVYCEPCDGHGTLPENELGQPAPPPVPKITGQTEADWLTHFDLMWEKAMRKDDERLNR